MEAFNVLIYLASHYVISLFLSSLWAPCNISLHQDKKFTIGRKQQVKLSSRY
jgi:hypothetical protein